MQPAPHIFAQPLPFRRPTPLGEKKHSTRGGLDGERWWWLREEQGPLESLAYPRKEFELFLLL